MIREYTHEAGVRNLEREIGGICRKVARRVAEDDDDVGAASTSQSLEALPRAAEVLLGRGRGADQVGVATGVARTELGGDVLGVEVTLMPGKGGAHAHRPARRGDARVGAGGAVLRALARGRAAASRRRSSRRTTSTSTCPAGAVPKDGPSAGITIATALISALTRRPSAAQVAMTGEITLRGRVLPVGGLKEKVLAAHRAGIKTFVLPKRNEKDLADVPAAVLRELRFVFAGDMAEVLRVALDEQPARRR